MELKPGYKQTDIGVIPQDWRVKTISNFAPLQRGFDLPTSQIKPGFYPVVYSNGVLNRHSKAMIKGPGVVTGRSGTIRKIQFIEEDYWPHNTTLWVTSFKGNDPKFAYYLYQRIGLERFSTGSGVPTLNRNDVHAVSVAIPPIPEQRTIADALSDVDALISALDKLISKKRDLKQAAMQQLLTGNVRLPGFHDTWEIRPLGSVASLYQPVTISARDLTPAGYPVYGANGVVGFYNHFNHELWQNTITCRGSTCGTVNKTTDKCWITGNAMVINCDANNQIDKEYLYHLLKSQDFSTCITGTGQPQIVRDPLQHFPLLISGTIEEQRAIAGVLSDMNAEIFALEERCDKTRLLKQGMMQELLTGRIRLV
jgi:type I restriction enzyme, S subunit